MAQGLLYLGDVEAAAIGVMSEAVAQRVGMHTAVDGDRDGRGVLAGPCTTGGLGGQAAQEPADVGLVQRVAVQRAEQWGLGWQIESGAALAPPLDALERVVVDADFTRRHRSVAAGGRALGTTHKEGALPAIDVSGRKREGLAEAQARAPHDRDERAVANTGRRPRAATAHKREHLVLVKDLARPPVGLAVGHDVAAASRDASPVASGDASWSGDVAPAGRDAGVAW